MAGNTSLNSATCQKHNGSFRASVHRLNIYTGFLAWSPARIERPRWKKLSLANTTAAAKNRPVQIPPEQGSLADAAEQTKHKGLSRRAAVPMFVFLTGALAALFPIVLWCSRGDASLAVWRLSLLLCSYFYSAVCALSADTAGMKVVLFFKASSVVLFAFLADFLQQIARSEVFYGALVGIILMYFISVVMAGVFGHALAEHRESNGAEQAASAAASKTLFLAKGMVVCAPTSSRTVMFFVITSAFVQGFAGGAKLLAGCEPNGCTVVELGPGIFLFMVISFTLLVGVFLELEPLNVAILGIDRGMVFVGAHIAVIAQGGVSFLLLGEVGDAVTLWILLLGLAAFYGYCVRVHDSYVKIIESRIPAVIKEINAARFENATVAARFENETGVGIEQGLTYSPTFF